MAERWASPAMAPFDDMTMPSMRSSDAAATIEPVMSDRICAPFSSPRMTLMMSSLGCVSRIDVRREKICDNCKEFADDFEENITLEDFLDSLSEEEQMDALVYLSLLWAEKHSY